VWVIKVALNRPYTFIVLALLILLLSPVIILTTPTDNFPNIDIPVVAVGWVYTGWSPQDWKAGTFLFPNKVPPRLAAVQFNPISRRLRRRAVLPALPGRRGRFG
jgi:hypothetical protein